MKRFPVLCLSAVLALGFSLGNPAYGWNDPPKPKPPKHKSHKPKQPVVINQNPKIKIEPNISPKITVSPEITVNPQVRARGGNAHSESSAAIGDVRTGDNNIHQNVSPTQSTSIRQNEFSPVQPAVPETQIPDAGQPYYNDKEGFVNRMMIYFDRLSYADAKRINSGSSDWEGGRGCDTKSEEVAIYYHPDPLIKNYPKAKEGAKYLVGTATASGLNKTVEAVLAEAAVDAMNRCANVILVVDGVRPSNKSKGISTGSVASMGAGPIVSQNPYFTALGGLSAVLGSSRTFVEGEAVVRINAYYFPPESVSTMPAAAPVNPLEGKVRELESNLGTAREELARRDAAAAELAALKAELEKTQSDLKAAREKTDRDIAAMNRALFRTAQERDKARQERDTAKDQLEFMEEVANLLSKELGRSAEEKNNLESVRDQVLAKLASYENVPLFGPLVKKMSGWSKSAQLAFPLLLAFAVVAVIAIIWTRNRRQYRNEINVWRNQHESLLALNKAVCQDKEAFRKALTEAKIREYGGQIKPVVFQREEKTAYYPEVFEQHEPGPGGLVCEGLDHRFVTNIKQHLDPTAPCQACTNRSDKIKADPGLKILGIVQEEPKKRKAGGCRQTL